MEKLSTYIEMGFYSDINPSSIWLSNVNRFSDQQPLQNMWQNQ